MVGFITHREPQFDVVDDFAGCGFSSLGAKRAGARLIQAVNHAELPCETYALNNPDVDVRQQDLLDFDPRSRPSCRVHISSPSCLRHSRAYQDKVYELAPNLFSGPSDDEPWLEDLLRRDGTSDHGEGGSVAEQERSRQTMFGPLLYAMVHRPEFAILENVVEAIQWGYRRPGSSKMGDGAHYRRWRSEWEKIDYEVTELFLCSAAFGVPQYRNRVYIVCRRRDVPRPDLDFRQPVWCPHCERSGEGVQTWKRAKPTWPLPRWGEYGNQYFYACARCSRRAELLTTPFYSILDTSDLGQRIGDIFDSIKPKRLDRMRRGFDKYRDEPGWVTTFAASHGSDRGMNDALPTLTSSRDRAVVMRGFTYTATGNTFEHPGQTRARSMWEPRTTLTSSNTDALLLHPPAAHVKVNGEPHDTAWHPADEPLSTLTSKDNTTLLMGPGMRAWVDYYFRTEQHTSAAEPLRTITSKDRGRLTMASGDVAFEDCTTRMLKPKTEGVLGMGAPLDYLWPTESATKIMRLLGQAVTPPVIEAIAERCFDALNEQRTFAA